MLTVMGCSRFFIYRQPVSMRKSFEVLSVIIEEAFPGELLTGAFFVFLSRRKDHMKVLYWDSDGLAIWYKRLEKGVFNRSNGVEKMTRKEFLMLLEGITPKRIQPRFSL